MSPSSLYIYVLLCPFVVGEMGKRNSVAKVIESVEARYEVQDVPMGKVYKSSGVPRAS